MSFFHYIDGQQVDEPKEWKDFAQEVVRDFERRSIGVKYPGTSTFTRGAYRMLRDMFVADDCGIVEYRCLEECGGLTLEVVRANIILADCKWNLSRCEVECSLVDDGADARIENNRGIPISPTADLSKNGVPITPVTPISMGMFSTVSGLSLPDRAAYDWLDCMKHAVQYMTDGLVTLESSWYDNLPDDERYAITTGYQIRTADSSIIGTRLVHKFEELFLEMAKKYNLWRGIRRDNAGNPIVFIEPQDSTFSNNVAASFPWTDNVVQTIERDQLWARVDVGSQSGIKNQGAIESLPFLVLQGFSTEEFHFETECNTDAVLDLVSKWGICTNLIQQVLGGDTSKDTLTFIVQYDRTTGDAVASDWLNPGNTPSLYNERLLNINVVNRYDLPSNIGVYYSPVDDSFLAQRFTSGTPVTNTTTSITSGAYVAAPFPVVISDPGGNYTPSDYTAPAQGFYVFQVVRRWAITQNTWPVVFGNVQKRAISKIRFERYDSFNVLVDFAEYFTSLQFDLPNVFTPPGQYVHEVSNGFVLNAGDYVRVLFGFNFSSGGDPLATGTITVQDQPLSTFGTTFVATGGGAVTNIDPEQSRVITYEFDRITNATDWRAMISDPTLAVQVAPDQALKLGHIQRASRNIYKGTTSYTLICKRSQK